MPKKLTLIAMLIFIVAAARMTCSAGELLKTTDFTSGISLPWQVIESDEKNTYTYFKDNKFVVHMDYKGTNMWDVKVCHREISLTAGHTYNVAFSLTANQNCKIYAKIGDQSNTGWEAWNNNQTPFTLTANQVLKVNQTFTASKDSITAEFAFYLGGELAGSLPYEIQFISMSLTDPEFTPTPTPTPTPIRDIRVNQLGYFPNAVKRATLKYNYGSATQKWELKNNQGTVVASGTCINYGKDHASGENVQIIDFSSYTEPGKDYQLFSGSAVSYPFDIGTNMYTQMKYDALKYFYHERSGIEIKLPYSVESKWSRPAGHPNDTADLVAGTLYNGPASIDGTGGWYDGGDYNKYAVDGGIALWTLQNEYEHSMINGKEAIFGDNKLNIPESGNGINDLLDETRWEMEWMLKLQIPSGYERGGMVAHKIADNKWIPLATRPDQDTEKRLYYPPSTAATLNLAACAAQAARIWKDIDPAFSARCLNAAQTAYAAALANPSVFAPYGQDSGSVTYGDDYVEDDFYWAACELYVTTGRADYLADLKAYKYSLQMPQTLTGEEAGYQGCFNWCSTSGLGTLTLALNKAQEFPSAIESIKNAADTFMLIQSKEGYEIPLAESTFVYEYNGQSEIISGYPYSSNTYVVNNAILMAYAYDLSKDVKYYNGMIKSMDYILGRNAIVKSYVSGYGENPYYYPNHHFFCPKIDPAFPPVPHGFLSSGPNSGNQDPWASSGLKYMPAQACFIDSSDAWATNEVKVSLNASLAWITYFMDTYNNEAPSPTPSITNKPTDIRLIEDIDQNGSVNMADVMIIALSFGSTSKDAAFNPKCDLNGDGVINMADIMKLAVKFGYSYTI
ncbi:MAG: glycoside hydrolase family 9 protein [Bacillota bacterium]|nr:glycoside hydrolase family 9 protein [Bacillota bacterium]